MYVTGNPKTKKALREAVQQGEQLTVFAPGLGTPKENGIENVEGPHYPEPHKWYARVVMKDGKIERVIS
jgi:hypothetical protein